MGFPQNIFLLLVGFPGLVGIMGAALLGLPFGTEFVVGELVVLAVVFGSGTFWARDLARRVTRGTEQLRVCIEQEDLSDKSTETVDVRKDVRKEWEVEEVRSIAETVQTRLEQAKQDDLKQYVMIEKLLEADQLKTQFLANISHDLRSPLNAILGFSELLLREVEGPVSVEVKTPLQHVRREGIALLQSIDELLDYAKVETRHLKLHFETVPVADLLTRAFKEVESRLGRPSTTHVVTELQPGLPMIHVDVVRLAQALAYLLLHAIEATAGHLQANVFLRVRTFPARADADPDAVDLQFRIADSSPGIAPEEVGQLFLGFRRRSGQKGFNLTLPLAKSFIELHGGTLQVYSAIEVGTTFIAELPLQRQIKRPKENHRR